MNELETALDDLDGLHEAFRALADPGRSSSLARSGELANALRQELAAGADAYLATLMSSSRGELDRDRLKKCRVVAGEQMPSAVANQKRLASLVEERRTSAPAARDDLRQLLTLSLHCRAALAALAPTVDRRMADSIGNKVLVELRAATLLYAATTRDSNDDGPAKARTAVLDQLRKTESHANEVVGLAPVSDGGSASLGAALSKDVVAMLHQTALDWSMSPAEARSEEDGSVI
jgi:hypothetical protein